MKDNLSLIAAAAGGFMLSIALAGILRGTPVTSFQEQSGVNYHSITSLQVTSGRSDEPNDYILEQHN